MRIIGVTAAQNVKSFLNPNAPTIGTATDIGTSRAYNNGAATVTFTPAATGAAATSFTATSSPGGYTATGASSPLTVTGLQSNTAYTFTVYASNSVGPSANSGASNSITATTVPQAPTIGTISSNTSATGRMNVTFTANATGGKSITGYTATSSPGGITATGSSPIVATGLTAGTSYTFRVTATNANGTSAQSSASNSAAASQYYCNPGSVSGSNCVYGASTTTVYNCPTDCRPNVVVGCTYIGQAYPMGNLYVTAYRSGGCTAVWTVGGVRCIVIDSVSGCSYGGYCQPECTTGTGYYCPSGGSLSGTTCTYSASIV